MTDIRQYLLLTEAPNYVGMFSDFLSTDEKAKALVDKYIVWARTTLKKNDRIIWFLRWVRVELAGRTKHIDSDTEIAKLNKRLKTNYSRYDMVPINNLMTNLTHFMGLPIAQIQGVVWQQQSPQELLDELKVIEDDWKESSSERNVLRYPQGNQPQIVIQFPDGYAWFDLETHSCSAEARAMGHCGNTAAGRSGETILSLRRLVKTVSGETYWYPVLTFILDDNGELGEMKGRNNDKPVERYHPYIVTLLRHRRITGIKGGGYMPSHNFHLSDLDDATREQLLKEKPDLAEVGDLYDKEGMTKRVMDRMRSGLRAKDLPIYDLEHEPEQKRFIVKTWGDFEKFIGDLYDDDLEKLLNIALGEADFQADRGDLEAEFFKAVVRLPEVWQERLLARAGMHHTTGYSLDEICIKAAHQLMLQNDDWFLAFEQTFENADRVQREAWERLAQYVEAGFPYAANQVYDNLPRGDDVEVLKVFVSGKETVKLYIGEQDLIYYASGGDDEDDYDYDVGRMREDGYSEPSWEHIDTEYQGERRREEKLVDRQGKDKWLNTVNQSEDSLADDFIMTLQGHRESGMIRDPRQQNLKFEAAMHRLLTLSGILHG